MLQILNGLRSTTLPRVVPDSLLTPSSHEQNQLIAVEIEEHTLYKINNMSVIPGYEYDLFISYRQRDNKGEQWVSEFVDALKTELESTIKEDITVFFDINTHDGLLETHNVDASLKDKLKSLIFIPIISRTYCDPKSYAWQHELCEFNRMAKEDQFGKEIRLQGGNVTSRILPVQIHDLDPEDRLLVENELGGMLRPIEFIFRSSGVSRPLKPDDSRTINLSHTFYRDQINKVAIAIKEIITGLKRTKPQGEILNPVQPSSKQFPTLKGETWITVKKIFFASIVIILLASGYFAISSTIRSPKTIDRSIAVLPFENLNKDPENDYLVRGIVITINRYLTEISELRVISLVSDWSDKNSKVPSPSNLLKGSIQRSGNKVRIEVQLIEARTGHQLWAENYDREFSDILQIQSDIAEEVASALKPALTSNDKAVLMQKTTSNTEAYEFYMKGYDEFFYRGADTNKVLEYYRQAIELDPGYAMAYSGIAEYYLEMAAFFKAKLNALEALKKAKPYIDKALELNPDLPEARTQNAIYLLYNNWDFEGAEREYKKSVAGNNSMSLTLYYDFLQFVRRPEEAFTILKRLEKVNPIEPKMGFGLYYMGKYDEAIEYTRNRLAKFNNLMFMEELGFLLLNTGQYEEAIESFHKAIEKSYGYPRVLGWLGAAYARSGQKGKAMELISELRERSRTTHAGSVSFYMGVIYAALNDSGSALECLNDAYHNHEMEMPWLISEPQLYSLHDDPGFIEIVKKIGFPWP